MARRSFKREYREDLKRELNVPGVGEHIVKSFQMIFKNWKLFLPLLLIGVIVLALTVGTMGFFNETAGVFAVLVFLILWLTTIYLTRQIMAKHKVSVRDGLYNAMTPLIATFVIFVVVVLECIPIILFIIAYSAAMETEFLTMPFYSILFWGFAGLMFTISGYLLPNSLIALIAVTAPGVYPFRALVMASELMLGRKMRLILRVVALLMVLAVIWAVLLLPLQAINAPKDVFSVIMMILICFSTIYVAIYLYKYYRYLLEA